MEPAFRFLDLPRELRLMVYEFLPVQSKRVTFVKNVRHYTPSNVLQSPSTFSLMNFSRPTGILGTCRFLREEALPTIAAKLLGQRFSPRYLRVPRIEADSETLRDLSGIIAAIYDWYAALKSDSRADFDGWLRMSRYDFEALLASLGYNPRSMSSKDGVRVVHEFVRKSGLAGLAQAALREAYSDVFAISVALASRPSDDVWNFERNVRLFVSSVKRLGDQEKLFVGMKSIHNEGVDRMHSHLWSTVFSRLKGIHGNSRAQVIVEMTGPLSVEIGEYLVLWQDNEWL
ncbi:hypothetical protein CC78DRAFT_535129 [Lojkania enalia]|uniref:F-box domain-containing protein n=1 Tax=Lojkania enalia TaxID=147567 RepID=A0A9P4K9S6_9PLEO|nr:hypothetical protein CC78DRAFT_535129 [Didymosphaeria enalia]